MKARLALFLAGLAAAAAASVGPGAATAQACGSYWNIPVGNACQWYTSGEGHSEYQFAFGSGEGMWASWSTYEHMMFFTSTAGGSWTDSVVKQYSPNGTNFSFASDKVGCHNHNGGTKWVNCHHEDI